MINHTSDTSVSDARGSYYLALLVADDLLAAADLFPDARQLVLQTLLLLVHLVVVEVLLHQRVVLRRDLLLQLLDLRRNGGE